MNPIFQYLLIKSSTVNQVKCPHCQHRFDILRKDRQRQVNCPQCGASFAMKKTKKSTP